ncbi:ABC transporter substrate-binding protein [Pseudoduganella sp. LjRoot289]|uniref:substrate-binding periplasmic protein n=1 Tax=Pseudoduganella sp. LjRoot289 TaxID=3342314 RepID=UPI003ECCF80D
MRSFGHTMVRYLPLAALLAGLCLPAAAQQRPACPAKPIVLGLYEFGRFYHAGTGLDKDIAEQLAVRSGCKFDMRVMLRGRIWQELHGGSVDMTLSAAAPAERKVFAWAIPYLTIKNMVILGKDVDASVRSPADFLAAPYLRLGMGRGHFPGKPYDGFITQLRNIARVDEADSTEQLYAMFKAGRFQAVIGTQLVYTSYFSGERPRIEDWAPGGPRDPVHLMLSKKNFSADDARRWGEVMKDMASDGTMQRLLERYVPPADAARMLAP